jgi:hypothetical protein
MGHRKLVTAPDGWSTFLLAWSLKINHISLGSLSLPKCALPKLIHTRHLKPNNPQNSYKTYIAAAKSNTHQPLPLLSMALHDPNSRPHKNTMHQDHLGARKRPLSHTENRYNNHPHSYLPYLVLHRLQGRLQSPHPLPHVISLLLFSQSSSAQQASNMASPPSKPLPPSLGV